MSKNTELCTFCNNNTWFFSNLKDNADYVMIDNAFKKHLPLETRKCLNWNPASGDHKLCKPCFDKADELTHLSSVFDKVQFEISEVVRQISVRILQGHDILDSQTSNTVHTLPDPVDNAEQEGLARPRKQKLSPSSVIDNFTLDYESNMSTVGPMKTRSKSKNIENNQVNIEEKYEKLSPSVPQVIHKISTKIVGSASPCFYLCETCNISFSDGDKLLKHIRFDDAVKLLGRHKCHKCTLSFTFISDLESHLKGHHIVKQMPVKPALCEERFKVPPKTHQLQDNAKKGFIQCVFCLTPMKDQLMMKKHTILHDKVNPMKCYLCPDEVLSSPLHFQQHIQQHKDGKVIKNSKAGKYKRQSYNKSASGNKDESSLNHSKELFRLLTETTQKNSKLPGKVLPSSASSSSSSNCYRIVQSQIASTVKSMFVTETDFDKYNENERNKKVWCDKCLDNFEDANDFDNHLVHDKNKCFFCKTAFYSSCLMIRHYSYSHNGEILPRFRCFNCQRNFKTERLLWHHKEQNQLCNENETLDMRGGGAESVSSVTIDDEKKSVCFEDYEETPIQMDALESFQIETESFGANQIENENYFEIKADPGTMDTFYEEVDT